MQGTWFSLFLLCFVLFSAWDTYNLFFRFCQAVHFFLLLLIVLGTAYAILFCSLRSFFFFSVQECSTIDLIGVSVSLLLKRLFKDHISFLFVNWITFLSSSYMPSAVSLFSTSDSQRYISNLLFPWNSVFCGINSAVYYFWCKLWF